MKVMGMRDTETSSTGAMRKQAAIETLKADDSVKFRLSQLVRQVEDCLKNSGLAQGPVYDFINDEPTRMPSAPSEFYVNRAKFEFGHEKTSNS